MRSSLVITQFDEILRSVELPLAWREAIVERCQSASSSDNSESGRANHHREELDAEQKRLFLLFTKGYITEAHLDEQMERIRTELFSLPMPKVHNSQKTIQEALSAGETVSKMADYWGEAISEERRDIVWSLLKAEGLIYDLERRVIVGLLPREGVLPVLSLGLEATKMWEQRDGGLWLREDYWPPKILRDNPHLPPPQPASLTPAQQEQAIMLIRQGMSLRKVADLFDTSYQSIYRLVKREGIVLQQSVAKLTSMQLADARTLLASGVSQRQIAKQLGVSPETLRRSLKRSDR